MAHHFKLVKYSACARVSNICWTSNEQHLIWIAFYCCHFNIEFHLSGSNEWYRYIYILIWQNWRKKRRTIWIRHICVSSNIVCLFKYIEGQYLLENMDVSTRRDEEENIEGKHASVLLCDIITIGITSRCVYTEVCSYSFSSFSLFLSLSLLFFFFFSNKKSFYCHEWWNPPDFYEYRLNILCYLNKIKIDNNNNRNRRHHHCFPMVNFKKFVFSLIILSNEP